METGMTSEQLFEHHHRMCSAALKLMHGKNHDYAGKEGDRPFANFERVEAMGITTVEKGFLVRLTDKLSRLATFCEGGILKVQDEKVEDTLLDVINYVVLLSAYLQDKKAREALPPAMWLYKRLTRESIRALLAAQDGQVVPVRLEAN